MDKPLDNNVIRFDWAMKRILRDVVYSEWLEEYFTENRDKLIARIDGYSDELAEAYLEGFAIGFVEGEIKGHAEGERKLKEERFAIARNLLSMGMIPDQVAQATGLSVEEIEQMQ